MSNQPTAQQLMSYNLAARQAIVEKGMFITKKVGTINFSSMGSEQDLILDNAGITTGLTLRVVATIDNTGTAASTPSPLAPYNFIDKVTYVDYDGVERTIAGAFYLKVVEAARTRSLGSIIPDSYNVSGFGNVDTNLLNVPTATGSGTLEFFVKVHLAVHPEAGDFRGAVLSQVSQGNHKVNVTLASDLVGDVVKSPYTAGTLSLTSAYVEVYQDYVMPPASANGQAIIPTLDLGYVYGVQGNYASTQVISANSPVYLPYPSNRTIFSSTVLFEDGGALTSNSTDIQYIKRIVNSNTTEKYWHPSLLRKDMRDIFGGDLPSNVFYFSSRQRPIRVIETGNVELEFMLGTLASSGTTAFYRSYEMIYPTSALLAGLPGIG